MRKKSDFLLEVFVGTNVQSTEGDFTGSHLQVDFCVSAALTEETRQLAERTNFQSVCCIVSRSLMILRLLKLLLLASGSSRHCQRQFGVRWLQKR